MPEPTKRCPYCNARIATDLKKCDVCDKKVGPPDQFNIAKKPFNWSGYFSAAVTGGAFFYFMYWLFVLKDK